jgi:GNAT superfamily N-acetyltransferase
MTRTLAVAPLDAASSMRREMPRFGLREYAELVEGLSARGYAFRTVSEMDAAEPEQVVYLRHDLDFSVLPALHVARHEASRGIRATYYILVNGSYNALAADTRSAIAEIASLGHEIGLHYDLQCYPDHPAEAYDRFRAEVELLGAIVRTPVRTVATHNPSLGGSDDFRCIPGLRHPHDPRDGRPLLYVSDSCRAWRDERLLECFTAGGPRRVMLLTHPESWLAPDVLDRIAYLRRYVAGVGAMGEREAFWRDVERLWSSHPGGELHDRREGIDFVVADRDTVTQHSARILERFRQFHEVPWTREQLLAQRDGKWQLSLLGRVDGDVGCFSFNSEREGALYVHAFFVAPELRRRLVGSALVIRLERQARAAGLGEIRLRVSLQNLGAVRFYLAEGFEIVEHEAELGQLLLSRPVP